MIEKLVGWLDKWLQGIMDRIAEKRSKKLRQMIDELKAYEAMEEQKRAIKHQNVVDVRCPEVAHVYEEPMPQVIEKSITELSPKDFAYCKHCGKRFYKSNYNQKFCSDKCRKDYWTENIDRSEYRSNSQEYQRAYYLKNREVILLQHRLRYAKKQKEKQYAKERAIANKSNSATSAK